MFGLLKLNSTSFILKVNFPMKVLFSQLYCQLKEGRITNLAKRLKSSCSIICTCIQKFLRLMSDISMKKLYEVASLSETNRTKQRTITFPNV